MKSIQVIDSHTGGEPTRLVIDGAPTLAGKTLAHKARDFRKRYDWFRSTVVGEPRSSDASVGALLLKPSSTDSTAGVIFFNNVGCLGMCVHATIGVAVTLAYLGRIKPGDHVFETPVGRVKVVLHDENLVSVSQVPSFRFMSDVAVDVDGYGSIHGDVAWGGNWFFLAKDSPVSIESGNVAELTALSSHIRAALAKAGVSGIGGQVVDHVELFSDQVTDPSNHSKNFVLCPGNVYDRSPCGTGTSAKLACLAADGALAPGSTWFQESIIGSLFAGSYQWLSGGRVLPTITGSAWVNGESRLLLNRKDPFFTGILR